MDGLSGRYRPLLLDGAWGTELQALGMPPGACPDLLNLTHPEWVASVARNYVEAGSDVILTNTFGANPIALRRFDAVGQCAEINRLGVELSREAAAGGARVFASMGPSGKMLFMGDVTEEELAEAFTAQAKVLAAAGADAIVIETMTDLDEAMIALRAAKTTGLPVVVSMVFDSGPEHDRTMMGLTPAQVAGTLDAAGADVIGANCGIGPATAVRICEQLHAASTWPIWIKPNAGLPVVILEDGDLANGQANAAGLVYPVGPEEFGRFIPALVDAGAMYIGGCCGTSPAHVRAMRNALDIRSLTSDRRDQSSII